MYNVINVACGFAALSREPILCSVLAVPREKNIGDVGNLDPIK
jgi:hypothetical protein